MNIRIGTPCHESWNNMIDSGAGRFCGACQKEVHDLTEFSRAEILELYEKQNRNMCGRISTQLLKDDHIESQYRKLHGHTVKRFFFALLFCFGASLFTIDSAKASTVYKLKLSFLNVSKSASDSITVHGVVKDTDGKTLLSFATVEIVHGDKVVGRTYTDANGKYTLKVGPEYKKIDVRVRMIGYKNETVKGVNIDPLKNKVVNVNMRFTEEILMGDVDINYIGN